MSSNLSKLQPFGWKTRLNSQDEAGLTRKESINFKKKELIKVLMFPFRVSLSLVESQPRII